LPSAPLAVLLADVSLIGSITITSSATRLREDISSNSRVFSLRSLLLGFVGFLTLAEGPVVTTESTLGGNKAMYR